MGRGSSLRPGAFTSSYFTTGNLLYVSKDRHTAFQMIYPRALRGVDKVSGAKSIRAAAAAGCPPASPST